MCTTQKLDLAANKIDHLYQHKHQVIALDLWQIGGGEAAGEQLQEKDVRIEINKNEEDEKSNIVFQKKPLDYSIVSIDDREQLVYYKHGKPQISVDIRS